ncbi:MAG: C4-dicarboxylate ABC transporter [Sneathiella sp.]|nr:MAG: C4-dicarboxylate ABC transporter [Sneathiella sp.]
MAFSLKMCAAAAVAALTLSSTTHAADVKLPSILAWSAYNTGTNGYNQAVVIGKALKDAYGVNIRVIPGKNDISRMSPLRTDKVQFIANGAGTFYASEGVYNFAVPSWGPQKVQLLMSATADINVSLAVTRDSGVKTMAGLKGKKVGIVRGSPALTIGTKALLAFGNLTFDDVDIVEFGGYGAMWKGMAGGQIIAALGTTATGPAKKLEATPHGVFWPPIPAADKEGWKRLLAVAPYFVPHVATLGTGNVDKDHPHDGAAYPFPILITRADQDPDLVYSMVKAINSQYDSYKNSSPSMPGWSTKNQTFEWAVPYHPAAVKYWTEIGVWTDEMEVHNLKLLKRQDILAEAWATMKDRNLDGDAFKAEWMKTRAAALEAAGMDPIFK